MEKISSGTKIQELIEKYHLQQYMDTDLADIAEIQRFERDEFLVRADEVSDYLYFLVSGRVMCFIYTASEKSECVGYYQAVALIGEAASLWNKAPIASVKALCECVCIAVSLNRYRSRLLNDLTFLQQVCRVLSARLNNENQVLGMEPLNIRLAQFMLHYSTDDIFLFQLNDCAEILNTSYRHLLRVLKQFSADGIVTKAHNGYLISNRPALQKIAGTDCSVPSSAAHLPSDLK